MNAPESKLLISDKAIKTIEEALRAPLSSDSPANAAEPCDDTLVAEAAAIADIEKLMGELLVARDYLQAEGERVRRVTAHYAHLTQTASASVKIIAESIGKWHNPELETASQSHAAMSEAPAPNLVHDGEVQPEPKEPLPELSNTTQEPEARSIVETNRHGTMSRTR
jgi:hypothetical protein